MNCRDFREIADSYLSDELLTETNHDMIRHMESCSGCRDLIGARREIRGRLKSAVIGASDYQLDANFDHLLMTRIKHEFENEVSAGWSSWFSMRVLAMAAGLLVVAMVSFSLISNRGVPAVDGYSVAGFSADSLMNIASGDHQHCAINHKLEEAPVSLIKGDASYAGLDKVVEREISNTLSDLKLVEAHACKYKNVRFAHIVMEGPADTLSVLVAPADKDVATVDEKMKEYSSEKYEVTSFGVEQNRVFVISNLKSEKNSRAAQSLVAPLHQHFAKVTQTAMLTAYPGVRIFYNR